MKTIIEILALCAAMVGGVAWLLNRPSRPSDPEEDAEQERYLTEWNHKHGKGILRRRRWNGRKNEKHSPGNAAETG